MTITLDETPSKKFLSDEDMPPSVRKIYNALKSADGEWVSGHTLNRLGYAYSQRCGDLVRLYGKTLDSRRIGRRYDEARNDSVYEYRLVPKGQTEMEG